MGKMSGINPETEESVTTAWTKENVTKLLAAMKASIPKQGRQYAYTKGMKDLVWEKVAFPPFSPEQCQKKWLEMCQWIRKVRTLTELITEAEEVISSSPDGLKIYKKGPQYGTRKRKRKRISEDTSDGEQSSEDEGLPSKPSVNGYSMFCKEQMAFMDGVPKGAYLIECGKRWRNLTQGQRDECNKRCSDLKNKYLIELNKYLRTLDKKERKQILEKHGIKKSKLKPKQEKKFPGEPKKPLQATYLIFLKEQTELLKEEFPIQKKRFSQISQMWKDLSDAEKRCYRERALKNNREYVVELQKWFKKLKPAEREDYLKSNLSQLQYLDSTPVLSEKRKSSQRPSDSEDEDIEDSSSDEEQSKSTCEESEEEEEEEEVDDISFNMF